MSRVITQSSLGNDTGNASIGGETNSATGGENTASYGFGGNIDEVRVYQGALTSTQMDAVRTTTHACAAAVNHLVVSHGSGTGLTCTPSTLTVTACTDAACATPYTGGISGTLTSSPGSMAVNWPGGAGFSIPAGSSSTTEDIQVTTAGSVLLGTTGVSPATSNGTSCNFGNPLCTFTAADSGFVFTVADHVADVAQTPISVTAVRKSDSTALCVPAFASVSKSVTFGCAYLNPAGVGTLPVRVGGSALNAGNSTAAACDAGGRAVSLAFNASGVAATTVQYADVGLVQLSASYTGASGGSEAGLVMTGSDTFTTAPYDFAVGGIAAGNIVAGASFAASVTARNYSGAITPNFGRESAAEGATLSFVRTQPSGAGASNGSYSGTLGPFSGGVASTGNLVWSEVGRGDVAAVLTSGSYLGSGRSAAGSSGGRSACASEGGTCTLPAGATAFVAYGANGAQATRADVTGSIGCDNGTFGDPLVGTVKACSFFVTGGAWPGQTGAAGRFVPHHFDVVVTPACSTFSYAAQPFTAMLSAMNGLATPRLTVNYDGSTATTPNFAQAVTLSDAPALGVGSFGSTGAVAASLFSAGVATTLTPAYSFTSKLTAAQTLKVRAIDADAVSSAGYAEGATGLRSGRLRLSNAFGSEKRPLPVAVQAQYWSGAAWVLNGADTCTSVPAAAVVLSGYLDNRGAATAAWTTTASAFSLSTGSATLTLAAPSGGATGSVDLALNLGSSAADQSCLGNHPASVGAALPWLRSQQGSCSALWDRDPAARASFGIYAPETRKTIYGREIF